MVFTFLAAAYSNFERNVNDHGVYFSKKSSVAKHCKRTVKLYCSKESKFHGCEACPNSIPYVPFNFFKLK